MTRANGGTGERRGVITPLAPYPNTMKMTVTGSLPSSESTFDTFWYFWEVSKDVKRYRFGLYLKRLKKRKKMSRLA